MRALPYFVNNLVPGLRAAWIATSHRRCVRDTMRDDLARLTPADAVPEATAESPRPRAVVLSPDGILLGAIDSPGAALRALDAMNPGPQTIRPDMTLRLATILLESSSYLLVTDAMGKYLGRYVLSG